MRASEFITEGRGKMHHNYVQASAGVHRTRDFGGYDRIYHANRLGMAMACADGKSTKPMDVDSASWVEKYNTVHPYTKEEENMLKSAMKTVPTDHYNEVSDRRSLEPADTNKVSPHKAFKGYKRK